MFLLDKLGVELRPTDFYSPAHRMSWAAMLDLWRASKPVDLITLAAALTTAGRLDAVGGPVYLGELAGSTISPANSPHHAGIVRVMAKRRAMLDMAMRMMEIAYDPEHDPAEFVGIAQLASDAVLKDRLDALGESPDEFLEPRDATRRLVARLQSAIPAGNCAGVLKSGISKKRVSALRGEAIDANLSDHGVNVVTRGRAGRIL